MSSSIIFVYNAQSNFMSKAIDFAHKIIHPDSYSCNLCVLTHGNWKEKSEWKSFKKNHDNEMIFYHIDEFESRFPKAESYPVIVRKQNKTLTTLLSSESLNKINSTSELIHLLNAALTNDS